MKRTSLIGVGLSGLALVAALLLEFGGTLGAQGGGGGRTASPVTVVNTPLGIEGSVAATQAGPWTVAINNTAPILVRDADRAASQPFRVTDEFELGALNHQRRLTTVPAGKRLVLEHISWWAALPTGSEIVFAALREGSFGQMAEIIQVRSPHASASPSFTIQDGSQPVRVYFEPGQEVWISVSSSSGNPSVRFQVILSGHYVDM